MAADRTEGVEDLAAKEEAGTEAALQRPRIDLGESDASSRDLGFPITLVPRPGERIARQQLDETEALVAAELVERPCGIDAGFSEECFGEAVRQVPPERACDRSRSLAQRLVPA